ncbi:MAG: hypothetical protein AAGA32_16450 [Pseudomonadota bacterium]
MKISQYARIDASSETVNMCIFDGEGRVLLERKTEAEPEAIIALLHRFARSFDRVGLVAGPTASWLRAEVRAARLPAICVECRRVKGALSAMRN